MNEILPGGYLYASRIGSIRGLISYIWLEFVPCLVYLLILDWKLSCVFILAHIGFLSLYEVGYRDNDVAITAAERGLDVRPKPVFSIGLWKFIGSRLLYFFAITVLVYLLQGPNSAIAMLLCSASLLTLFFLHTRVGSKLRPKNPLRWICFGWLATFKYMPALLACLSYPTALTVSTMIFLVYSGGRFAEYCITKQGGTFKLSLVDPNTAWFLATLPLAVAFIYLAATPLGYMAIASVIAAHHAISTSFRFMSKMHSKL